MTTQTEPRDILKEYIDRQKLGTYVLLLGSERRGCEYPDLLFSMQLDCLGETHRQASAAQKINGHFMANTLYEADFFKLINSDKIVYNGAGQRIPRLVLNALKKSIFQPEKWSGEWLNNSFYFNAGVMWTKYTVAREDGKTKVVDEPLENCLMQNRIPGVSLESWLQNPTRQGFPRKSIKKGDLNYWGPRDGTVARFVANSVRAGLGCGRSPQDSGSDLGVRPVCVAPAKI